MSDKVIFYNTNTEKVIGAYGGAEILYEYTLTYKACPVWEIHFVTVDEEGQYIPTDLTKASAWRAAVDTDFRADTEPMVRTLPNSINCDQANEGILLVQLDADTEPFLAKVDGKESVAGVFELRGTNVDGKTIYSFRFDITCYGAVDPTGTSPLPVADGSVTQDWVLALLRAGREIQYSADSINWHDDQIIDEDHYFRERYPNGEWSEAIWFKDEAVATPKIQYSTDNSTWSDSAENNSIYIRFSLDNGSTWSNSIYVKGNNGFSFEITGQYNSSKTYSAPSYAQNILNYQIVYYKGSSWLYKNPESSSGIKPPETPNETSDYWQLIAAKGTDGDIGIVQADDVQNLNTFITNLCYTKTAIDINFYNKTSTNTLLNSKANTDDVYNKTEIDDRFNAITESEITQEDLDLYTPLATYTTDINSINTALTNVQVDLDEKLQKNSVYNLGEITADLLIDGKLGDYQILSIADGATLTLGQQSFYNFETGDGIVLEITKSTTNSELIIDGKIILDNSTSGQYLIGIFNNGSRCVLTAPTEIIA